MVHQSHSELEDVQLVALAKNGNKDAFGELIKRHSPKILSIASRMLGSRDKAWDASQDASLDAWRGIGKFRGESSFYTWLRRITVHRCLAVIRKDSRLLTLPLEDFASPNAQAADERDLSHNQTEAYRPVEHYEQLELRKTIEDGISELPGYYRVTFVLREVEGMSYKEIASVLGVSEGTVKSRLNAAKRQLRKKLEESGAWNTTAMK